MKTLDADIGKLLASRRFALIGAGQLAGMTLSMWPADVPKPEFVLDSVKTGTLDGLPILPLPDHRPIEGVTYLISVFKLPAATVKQIFKSLGQEILTVYDFFEEHMPEVFSNGWRNMSPSQNVADKLDRLGEDYSDPLSRKIVDAVTAWRYRRELLDDYPVGPEEIKYDLGLFGRGATHYDLVYDCGCYDLGLFGSLGKAAVTYSKVIAFEADPARHEKINEIRTSLDGDIEAVGKAVSDFCGQSSFIASGLLSARLTDAKLERPDIVTVDVTTLDAFHEERFGWNGADKTKILLKLHIEGAELPAIRGALRLLGETKADIMLNLSHDEVSYLETARLIAEIGRHDIFLRSHSLFGEGLTLTAVLKDN